MKIHGSVQLISMCFSIRRLLSLNSTPPTHTNTHIHTHTHHPLLCTHKHPPHTHTYAPHTHIHTHTLPPHTYTHTNTPIPTHPHTHTHTPYIHTNKHTHAHKHHTHLHTYAHTLASWFGSVLAPEILTNWKENPESIICQRHTKQTSPQPLPDVPGTSSATLVEKQQHEGRMASEPVPLLPQGV